ncbi:MAG: hypothetical protein HN742_01965 [Lentisphaerae bacterium]|jgi:hypothetical protein|nr:hypothetical protein [Lentisphaerota bacterium]MBT4820746.1 hypothetical protein [Lentisphaerota bacterium]MBT5612374.1 hypothetical protein [Lentisphaerota bacterium]MBT7056678.1 hypothetical protein [Lentisphaerota bacterium]MBT7840603.1 hypothetical protein [Lentisphaerota bacterium]
MRRHRGLHGGLAGTLVSALLLMHVAEAELAEPTETVPWQPHFGQGVWQVEGGLALVPIFSLAADQKQLAVEVEAASSVLCHPDAGERPADGTGAGRVVLSPKHIEVFVDVAGTEATAISLWYRVRRVTAPPDARFLQGVDASLGAPVGWVPVNSEPAVWTWLSAEQHPQLRPGRHELQLTGIPPGIEWDQLVMSRDSEWKPPPDGAPLPTTATPALPQRGTVTTADATFPEVRRWQRLRLGQTELRGGGLALSVSVDQGKTWQAVPDNGSLEAIAPRGDGTDSIRVRATLTREGDGLGPLIGRPQVTYATPEDATFTVDCGPARWIFARRTGALCGIVHQATGTALIPVNRPVPLFEARLKPPGYCEDTAWQDLDALHARCVEAGEDERHAKGFSRKLRFRYLAECDDGSLDVTVWAAFADDGDVHWTSRLTSHLKTLDVTEFTWPILNNVKTMATPETDRVLLGGCYLFEGPCRVGRFFYPLPGSLLMPMLDLSGDSEGITLVSRDPTYRNVMMACAGQRDAGVRLSLHKVLALKPGQTYEGPPNVVRIHTGDWRHACLLEREDAHALYPEATDILPSVREMDGLEMEGWAVPRWDLFGTYARKMQKRNGFNHLGLWNFQVPKTYWNTPHPNPMMGNAEDLKWAIRAFRESGMRITFYIQSVLTSPMYEGIGPDDQVGYLKGRHLWPGWDLPPKGWTERFRTRKASGEPGVYGHGIDGLDINIPMAHGSRGYHEYKMEWAVERFGRQIGLDGIYWDSNSKAQPSWGTNDRYGNDPGLSAVALLDTQRAINDAYTRLRPGGHWTWGEGSPSAYMRGVRHAHLANAYSLYPIRMLFPQMVLVPSGANGQDKKMHKAFLAGARLYGVRLEHGKLQHAMIAMRRKVKQYLYPASYRHDLDLKISDERIQASLSLCDPARTRGAVLNILNLEQVADATITIDTSLFGPVRTTWVTDSDGRDESLPVNATEQFELPVPTAEASHILLLNRAEPRITATVEGELAAGGTVPVRVVVESLTNEHQQGVIALKTPPGLHATPAEFDTTDQQSLNITLRADLDATTDIFDLPTEVRLGERRKLAARMLGAKRKGATFERVVTLYVHEPITWELVRNGPEQARLRLRNETRKLASLTVDLKAGEGTVELADGPLQFQLGLAPGEQKDLDIGLTGATEAMRPWRLRGTMRYRIGSHQEDTEIYRQFWPIIANGSLELCEFRHDAPKTEFYSYAKTPDKMTQFMPSIPDYWWGMISDRSPQVTHHEGVSLDDKIPAAQGRKSFRLEAGKRARTHLILGLVAGTRYRVSASLRASKPSPDCWVRVGSGALRLTDKHAPDTWHKLTTEFTADQDDGHVYLFTSADSVTWFDAFNAVPLSASGEAGTKEQAR